MSSGGEEGQNNASGWETGDGKMVDNSLMNSLLKDILDIKCSKYIYNTEKEEPGSPAYVIKVRDKIDHVLTVFPEKEDIYNAESSDNPTPFSLYSWRIDNIIEKFDRMLGEEDKKEVKTN
jgi:hypothetical protein